MGELLGCSNETSPAEAGLKVLDGVHGIVVLRPLARPTSSGLLAGAELFELIFFTCWLAFAIAGAFLLVVGLERLEARYSHLGDQGWAMLAGAETVVDNDRLS
jgi:hypothetical protein